MKTLLLGISFLMSSVLCAQVTDNFNDSDLLINPPWEGELNNFNTIGGALHSNNSVQNALFYVSTPSLSARGAEWRLNIKLLLNTSSLNYTDFVVMSDTSDIASMSNGYFIRLGGTTDEVSLYKTKGGVESKIIDGADNVLNSSNNQWNIILIREQDGTFTLKRQANASADAVIEGVVIDNDISYSAYLGIRVKQSTASFFGKHYFDDLYAGKIIRDTIAPACDSLIVQGSKMLLCIFNENCDSISLSDINHYSIMGGTVKPVSADLINKRSTLLTFQNEFLPNQVSTLVIENITDITGNQLIKTSRNFIYSKPDTAGFRDLLITELMADPDPPVGLPNTEYAEITNVSGRFIQLKGCRIHDPSGSKNLPDLILAPDSIVSITSVPSLNNTGDRIWLTSQTGEIIHSVSYTDQWYKDDIKKKGGWSLEMIDVKNVCAGSANWRASIDPKGGTPGKVNSVKGTGPADHQPPRVIAVIPLNDSILQIDFDEEIDSMNSLLAGVSRNGQPFPLKLIHIDPDNNIGLFRISFQSDPDSLYRLILYGISDCSGNTISGFHFDLQWPSNSQRSDIIFNEILFNPRTGGADFIELYNRSDKAFDLSKHFIAVLDDRQQYKSIDKISDGPLYILPHQYLLMSADTANICEFYACKDQGAIKFKYSKMPSMPDDKGNLLLLNLTATVIDSMVYSEQQHFPLLSDKEGVSLERLNFDAPTCSAHNWHSASSVSGFATPGYLNSQSVTSTEKVSYFTLQNQTVSPDEDGYEDVLILNYHLPQPDFLTSAVIYDTEGRLIRQWVNNETIGTTGFLTWNGTDYNEQKAAIGMYILMIESIHPDGQRIREKMSFTVAGKF